MTPQDIRKRFSSIDGKIDQLQAGVIHAIQAQQSQHHQQHEPQQCQGAPNQVNIGLNLYPPPSVQMAAQVLIDIAKCKVGFVLKNEGIEQDVNIYPAISEPENDVRESAAALIKTYFDQSANLYRHSINTLLKAVGYQGPTTQ